MTAVRLANVDWRAHMDPVTVSIVVDRPREQVFDYLQDIANHAEFTDHYLRRLASDAHRLRRSWRGRALSRQGPRAAGRFAWGDVTFVEVDRPHRIVEAGRTGKNNRVRTLGVYELAPGASGTTRVQFTLETQPATLADRLLEGFGARGWMRRQNARAMRRLRTILESDAGRGRRVTVAGG